MGNLSGYMFINTSYYGSSDIKPTVPNCLEHLTVLSQQQVLVIYVYIYQFCFVSLLFGTCTEGKSSDGCNLHFCMNCTDSLRLWLCGVAW